MPKNMKEWSVTAYWGKIAVVSWGNPANPPVLLVHGYMDTAATFIPLVDELSDDFYYVGVDLPGHGKSEPFPPGFIISKIHMVEVLRCVVEQMKWKNFIYMAHSVGCIIGIYYNNIFPGKIKKMVLLDPIPPLAAYHFIEHNIPFFYKMSYNEFYSNFQKWNSKNSRLYTYDDAIYTLVRNRNLSEEQSEIVLSRSLVHMGIDSYKLSWDTRMKKQTLVPIPEETLYSLMTANMPPTLNIDASESKKNVKLKAFAENLLHKCDETLPHFHRVTVIGGHDVHITNPELLKQDIEKLFKTNFEILDNNVKSKL